MSGVTQPSREIAPEFLAFKDREWAMYDRQVTPWEIDTYLTLL
jgi:glutamine synthetase